MNKHASNLPARHPIRVVSARTGIPQDLLRAWEKRYRAVVPGRGPTGRRLYSDQDIDKLRLLKRAVAGGRRISDVASMTIEELKELIQEDRIQESPPVPGSGRPYDAESAYLLDAVNALEEFDIQSLTQTLADAAISLSKSALREQVLIPLLHLIGDRWQDGSLRIVHEHLLSVIVRSMAETIGNGTDTQKAPQLLVTTPSGQRHEFGALMAAAAAKEYGWNVTYLGPDLPAEEIAAAVKQLQPQALALSIVYQDAGFQLQEELQNLRRYLDGQVNIVVGGRAVSTIKPLLNDLECKIVEDLSVFPEVLADFVG